MHIFSTKSLVFAFIFTLIVIWNEFIIYYFYLFVFCRWPSNVATNESSQLKVLVLSDTHLLGTIRGHWFDKLRREWQMYRSFQTSINIFSPNISIILGDVFDEGQWASVPDFERYVQQFYSIFHVGPNKKLYVVAGNHDIGFHYWTNPFLYRRFDRHMNTTSVDLLNPLKNIYFIRINSIAMENDKCTLCDDAIRKIESLSNYFEKMPQEKQKSIYPIILTHFPMFRPNESVCEGRDDAPVGERLVQNREGIDCFSKNATDYLLSRLKPRLILNGHVHQSCRMKHKLHLSKNNLRVVEEWTVASFSWRNQLNPSFLLLHLSDIDHRISKCFLPNENLVLATYFISLIALILLFLFLRIKFKLD